MRSHYGIFLFVILVAAGVSGCKKKETPAQAASPDATNAQPAANAQAPNQPAPAPAASTETYDAVVTARSIDYLRGQVTRKDWAQARIALKQVEGRPLTPQQRQYVDSLKSQIPNQ
jgi:hypothetical protein